MQVMMRHSTQPVPRIRDLAPDVPREIEQVLLRMMAKRPEDRFSSAAEVQREIRPFVQRLRPTSHRVFISYRRADARAAARQLFDALETFLGAETVFMDIDTLPPGIDFRTSLDRALARCEVVLVMIGPDWKGASSPENEPGVSRLDHPGDFVRLEVSAAIRRGAVIVPVLINEARMPAAAELPSEISSLAFRQAASLRLDQRFLSDAQRIAEAVRRFLNPEPEPG